MPPAERNSSDRSAIDLAFSYACSPREIARSGITLARENTWTPYRSCASNAACSLSLVKVFIVETIRRISSMCRPAPEPMWMWAAQFR